MSDFEQDFKKRVQPSRQSMPPDMKRELIKEMNALRVTKKGMLSKLSVFVAVAALFIALVMGTAYVSPTVTQALQAIPYIGVAFEKMGDSGLQQTSSDALSTPVNKTFQIGDISVTITEIIYDGVRLAVAYSLDTGDDRRAAVEQLMDVFRHVSFAVDGERIGYGGIASWQDIQAADEQTMVGMLQLRTTNLTEEHFDALANEFTLTMEPDHLRGRASINWRIDVPVQQIDGVRTYWVFETLKTEQRSIHVEKITYGPATAGIQFEVAESMLQTEVLPRGDVLFFSLYDDQGNELSSWRGSRGSYGYDDERVVYTHRHQFEPPTEDEHRSFVLEPWVWPTDGRQPYALDELTIAFTLDATVQETDRPNDPFGERRIDESKHIVHPANKADLSKYYDPRIIATFDLNMDAYTRIDSWEEEQHTDINTFVFAHVNKKVRGDVKESVYLHEDGTNLYILEQKKSGYQIVYTAEKIDGEWTMTAKDVQRP